MAAKEKSEAKITISGAGVLSVNSNEIFKTAKGKKQIKSLRKIHNQRKKV